MKSEAHFGTPPMAGFFLGGSGAGGGGGGLPNEKKLKPFLAGAASFTGGAFTPLPPPPRGFGICRAEVVATKTQKIASMAKMVFENMMAVY